MDYKAKTIILTFAVSLFSCFYSFAQSDVIDANQAERTMITQILSWDDISYASRYEVEIEKRNSDIAWVPYGSYVSEVNSIELELPAGIFRYRLIVYNVLNRAEPASEWFEFTVFQAQQPTIIDILPNEILLNSDTDGVVQIVASNVVDTAEFFLESTSGQLLQGSILEMDGDIFILDFDEKQLIEGVYTLIVSNPSGLEDKTMPLVVKKDKLIDLSISGGYTASAVIPGGTIFPNLSTTFLPLGFHANVSVLPLRMSFDGLSFGVSFRSLTLQQAEENYAIRGLFFPLSLYASYAYPIIEDRIFFTTQVGAGVNFLYNLYQYEGNIAKGEPLNAIAILSTAGIGVQFFTTDNIFFNLNFDYNCSFFLEDTFLQMMLPSASIGFKL